MKKITQLLTLFGLFAVYSCINDDQLPGTDPGEQTSVYISAGTSSVKATRGFDEGEDGDEEDNVIKEFRILIFKPDGKLAHNIYVPDIEEENPKLVELRTGTYDFVFIGNEGSDPAVSSSLAALTPTTGTLSGLESLAFTSTAFDSAKNIPMAYTEKGVQIVGDNRYIIKGVEYNTNWVVNLIRLGVRVDVKIFTESEGKKDAFTKLEISNVPNSVYILETNASGQTLYNGGTGKYETTPRSILVGQGDSGSAGFQPAAGGFEWKKSRIILPSSRFNPDSEQLAVKMTAVYSASESASVVFKTGLEGDFQVPRNYYFVANLEIAPALEIYLEASQWDDRLIENLNVGSTRSLNVSALGGHVTEFSRKRIWFSSDQPKVYVDSQTAGGLNVNSYFRDLAGENAANLHYEYDAATGLGTGYIDIMTDRDLSITSNYGPHKIRLNAGNLKREITLTASDIGGVPEKIGYFEYVGAFWKNDQTGERLISGRNQGAWSAKVLAGDWIVLGTGKSADPNVYTTNPGDAENYQVEGNRTEVSGSGYIFFRIGLKSKNPNKYPRYGLVEVTVNKTTARIYIRQGEEPDYLFRRVEDGRAAAVKFSPYNMTAKEYYNSPTNTGGAYSTHPRVFKQEGKEVEFPSQAGAFFQWGDKSNGSKAYHPVYQTASFNKNDWESNLALILQGTEVYYWNAPQTQNAISGWDICPPGYRRPYTGASLTGSVTSNKTSNCEFTQSLWKNTGSYNTTGVNAYFGYYADGFFDRRPIEEPIYQKVLGDADRHKDSAVARGQAQVAYAGCLFFNENTNASLFFPSPGQRLYNTGSLQYGTVRYTGIRAMYWSANSSTSSGWKMYIESPSVSSNDSFGYGTRNFNNLNVSQGDSRGNGANIRCVKDE